MHGKVGKIYRDHINTQLKICLDIPSTKAGHCKGFFPWHKWPRFHPQVQTVTISNCSAHQGSNKSTLTHRGNCHLWHHPTPLAVAAGCSESLTETGVAKCFCSHVTRSGGLGWGYPAQLYSLELLVVLLGRGRGCSPHLLARSWLELEHFHFLKSWISPKILITHSVLHFISQTANKSSLSMLTLSLSIYMYIC